MGFISFNKTFWYQSIFTDNLKNCLPKWTLKSSFFSYRTSFRTDPIHKIMQIIRWWNELLLHHTFLKDKSMKKNRCKLWKFNWNHGYVCSVQHQMVDKQNVSSLTRKSSSKLTDTILPCDRPTCSLLEFAIIINIVHTCIQYKFRWKHHFHWTYRSTKDYNKSISILFFSI